MNRASNITLAALFLTVGIWSAVNSYRFNHYVHDALKRDAAQEQCQKDTIATLKKRNEVIGEYLKLENEDPALARAVLTDKLADIKFPNCDFGAR